MGGNIWVESKLWPGQRFSFHRVVQYSARMPKNAGSSFQDIAGIRAMVVDDNRRPGNPHRILKCFALRVDSVPSGEDAIRELVAADSQDPYRLVMMDWHMPGNEWAGSQPIVKSGDRLKNIPRIVMVTAFAATKIRTQSEQVGMTDSC